MENKFENFYEEKPTLHKVNVFHAINFHRFLRVSCDTCKLKKQCEPIRHKREICELSKHIEIYLEKFISGKVSGFIGEEFYVQHNGKKNELNRKIRSILRKYSQEEHVR